MEEFPSGTIWDESREDRIPRRASVRHPAIAARDRRLGMVAAAVSLGLFLFSLLILGVELHDGETACGSAMSPTRATGACEDSAEIQRIWFVVVLAMSLGFASWSFRLRWGNGWTDVRHTDAAR